MQQAQRLSRLNCIMTSLSRPSEYTIQIGQQLHVGLLALTKALIQDAVGQKPPY
jgi:hypothetical protein